MLVPLLKTMKPKNFNRIKDMEQKDLLKKIKEMEAEKMAKVMSSSDVKVVTADSTDKISFDQWWIMINKRFAAKPWMKEILRADFNGRGLSENESKEAFDNGLKACGF